MKYKLEAVTTKAGNVMTFKVYKKKTFLFFTYWSFMCNQSTFTDAEKLINNLRTINSASNR